MMLTYCQNRILNLTEIFLSDPVAWKFCSFLALLLPTQKSDEFAISFFTLRTTKVAYNTALHRSRDDLAFSNKSLGRLYIARSHFGLAFHLNSPRFERIDKTHTVIFFTAVFL